MHMMKHVYRIMALLVSNAYNEIVLSQNNDIYHLKWTLIS